jgi:hypothetical protein
MHDALLGDLNAAEGLEDSLFGEVVAQGAKGSKGGLRPTSASSGALVST